MEKCRFIQLSCESLTSLSQEVSTTIRQRQMQNSQSGGTVSSPDAVIQLDQGNDDSDEEFIPSDSESDSDDDANAVVGKNEEQYVVDFPEKPQDFDEYPNEPQLHPCLLAIVHRLQHSRYHAKWNSYDAYSFVHEFLSSNHGITRLKHIEMNIIQGEVYKYFGKKIFNVSALKAVKVEQLVRQFCPSYLDCLPNTAMMR